MSFEWPPFAHTGPLARAHIAETIALASGDLRVEFETEAVARKTVTFRLRALNSGRTTIRCNVSTTEPAREPRASLLDLDVVPRELLDVSVAVRRKLADSVVAEFTGPGLSVFVRAPDPALPERKRTPAGAPVAGGAPGPASSGRVALGAVAALFLAAWLAPTPLHPRVEALSVPPAVAAGADIQVAYALQGTSTGTYRLRDAGGAVIDSGPVASSDGSLTIKAPAAAPPGSYSIEVSAAPEFLPAPGWMLETRAAPVTVLPGSTLGASAVAGNRPRSGGRRVAAPNHPVVDSADLEKSTVQSGQQIVVDYSVSSVAGEVRLLDAFGTVRGEALLNHGGNSILIAPNVDVAQDFKVALNVDDGNRHDERDLPVRIEPSPGPSASPGAAPENKAAEQKAKESGKPFALAENEIEPGGSIILKILKHFPSMQATLLDKDGNQMAFALIAPRQSDVTLDTPPNTPPGSYTVIVTYMGSNGQESVIAPIAIRGSSSNP